ncbi:MAG: hypothetical protein HY219_03025 [Candidatus Staskawiczbacteria bacterium]|nr:hypothetical protein [Candidatus Staskawiczbacteria bacterium]
MGKLLILSSVFPSLSLFLLGALTGMCMNSQNRLLKAIGTALVVVSCMWLFHAILLDIVSHESNASITTPQIQVLEKPKLYGCPINYNDLPDGSYWRMEEEECFAFVQREQREDENPFEGGVIAVCSDEKIPWHFAIAKITEEMKKEIKKIEKINSVKGPLARTTP